jgi:hypothetical protein
VKRKAQELEKGSRVRERLKSQKKAQESEKGSRVKAREEGCCIVQG